MAFIKSKDSWATATPNKHDLNNYLRQGGYVFTRVCCLCLFLSEQYNSKVVSGFWWTFQELSAVGSETSDLNFGVIWKTFIMGKVGFTNNY